MPLAAVLPAQLGDVEGAHLPQCRGEAQACVVNVEGGCNVGALGTGAVDDAAFDIADTDNTALAALRLAFRQLVRVEPDAASFGALVSFFGFFVILLLPRLFSSKSFFCPSPRQFTCGGLQATERQGIHAVADQRDLERVEFGAVLQYPIFRRHRHHVGVGMNADHLVAAAWQAAGPAVRHLSHIETHGTGTPLGDPIEIDGLQQAFTPDTSERQFCAIGSAKSNIGHLEPASGVLLQRALINLLDNARHHGRPPVVVRLQADGGHATLTVRDHGPGIAPEQRETLLRPFYRGASDRGVPGTGLGLPVVERCVRRHGGEMQLLDAAPGLAVRLRFPLAGRPPSV